jgi:hypothetical protein
MTASKQYGAKSEEWRQATESGLTAHLLPVVSNPELKASAKSNLTTRGKVPSVKNAAGEVVGLPGWTSAPDTTATQIQTWAKDPDLGFCVRTGRAGIFAIDADIDDPALSAEIEAIFKQICGAPDFTKRTRGNARWATLVRLDDITPRGKQIISVQDGQKIEILATGQQLVCAGTHPGGARYEWTAGVHAVKITAKELDAFINTVTMLYGTETTSTAAVSARQKGQTFSAPDAIADWLSSTGRILGTGANREIYIKCPWCGEHTADGGITETAYFPAGSNGYTGGGFKCLHAHCSHRSLPDFLAWAKGQGFTETSPENYPQESDADERQGEDTQPTAGERLQAYRSEKTGFIEPCASSAYIALSATEITGFKIAYDTFRGKIVIKPAGAKDADPWTLFTEERNLEIRIALEKYGFKPGKISKDLISDAVRLVASESQIDTMRDYLARTLPKWDGTPRAERSLATYCGADDTPYTRAVGRYFWGMLWRRASSPIPIKADISLVLIGAQGANKTRFIKALTPLPETHTELNFNLSASELAMRMGGRIIAEFPEMIGFGKRKLEEIKAFLTLEADTYRPLYSSDQRTVTRRCLFVMTTNNLALFSDRTGNRRYAPVKVGRFNADAIAPDLLQLWAEGKEIYTRYGGLKLHQDVERITAVENDNFILPDSWESAIADWLEAQAKLPEEEKAILQSRTILNAALGFNDPQVKRDDLARVADIMQALGFIYKVQRQPRLGGKTAKVWARREDEKAV